MKLTYLNDDIDVVVDRILNDKELDNCGLGKRKVTKCLKSFDGDEIATSVFLKKYALRNTDNEILELTLSESKGRWAKAMVGAEGLFKNKLKEEDYFKELYDYMLPAGRQMFALGNTYVKKATLTNCVSGQTVVLTDEGFRLIKDLCGKECNIIINNEVFPAKVWKSGEKQTEKLITKEGFTITATSDHRFLLNNGSWKKLENLKKGDKLALSVSERGFGTEEEFDEINGYAVGVSVKDGTFCGEKLLTENVKQVVHKSKTMPPKIITQSSTFFKHMLSGLFDADGSVIVKNSNGLSRTIVLYQSDKKLLQSVQKLLLSFKIKSVIYKKTHDKCSESLKGLDECRREYSLCITDKSFATFVEKIGFRNKEKQEEATSAVKMAPFQDKSFYATVSKIVPFGIIPVYDLSIDSKPHAFYANGFVAHNCYVTKIEEDSLEGIFDAAKRLAKTYSYGGGIGLCIGGLRPSDAKVSNSARYSTGAVSFMELFSLTTGLIGQSGRRGANMITIPVNHPDIENFVEIKHNNIDKVKHANISIKLSDEFMRAVENDEDFELSFDTKHEKISRTVRAKDLWMKIIQSARDSAEPGLLFWDRAVDMSPSDTYESMRIHSTNPCLSGDMLVHVADGRVNVSIKTLADEGKDVPVFCLNEKGAVVVRVMRNPRVTGYQPVFKINLNDGNSLKATANHKFLLADGEYREVKDLKEGDSFKQILEVDFNYKVASVESAGFETVYNGTVDEFHNFCVGGFQGKTKAGKQSYIVSKNCGEQFLDPGGACVLASLLLHTFVKNPFTEAAEFDYELFSNMAARGVRHLDNIIELNLGSHALEEQERSARMGRRIGLGITGVADMFASMGIKYDSQEALDIADKIMTTKKIAEYDASISLAAERGSFELFDATKHFERGFAATLPDWLKDRGRKCGLRNVALSTIAPSGSLSIVAQCSSGGEPIFALKYKRFVEMGQKEKKEFTVFHQGLIRYFHLNNITDPLKHELPDYWVVSHEIDYNYRLKLQGVFQRHIDASISSTINLPKDIGIDVVGDIYMKAWKEGLKGITVYREGSREGILITDSYSNAAGEPIVLDTTTHCIRAEGGDKFYVMISYKDKNIREPYQVFVLNYKRKENDSFIKTSNVLIKMLLDSGVSEKRIEKYSERSDSSLARFTRFLSLSMKTGNFERAAAILEENAFVGTLSYKLYEIFKNSIETKKMICENPKCKSSNIRVEEGCVKCLDCQWNKCGG